MNDSARRFLAHRPTMAGGPSVWHHNWFILRRLRAALRRHIALLGLRDGADVLDFGCADSPYRSFFPAGIRYVGADLPGNPYATVAIGPGSRLALPDASMDLVLSTQVLEHVEDPVSYVRECLRVLRSGGRLLLTTHGFWVYHRDPVDYWRWTADGLVRQVEQAGFSTCEIEGVGGLSATAVQLFQDATRQHVPGFLRDPYTWVLQRLAALFDRMHGPGSRRANAMVFLITARKPD